MHRPAALVSQALAALALACLWAGAWVSDASAHQIRPSLAEIDFADDGSSWSIVFTNMNLEALIAGVGPGVDDTDGSVMKAIYDGYREMEPAALRTAFDSFAPQFLAGLNLTGGDARLTPELKSVIIPPVGDLAVARDSIVSIGGPVPKGVTEVTFSWDPVFGDVVLRTVDDGEGGYSGFLTGGDASAPIPVTGALSQTALQAAAEYVVVGFEHILPKGLDHILFVVGLFLLSTRLRPLLVQITSFTVAHTITLALGVLGIVTIPPSIVEPLIALSIVYVAVENVMTDHLSRFRPVLVVFFGLLHGLGFAGVLSEFGLAPGQFVVSLISFNVGVEIGQLTVIAICLLLFGFWFGRKSWYHDQITIPISLAISATAICWFYERAVGGDLGVTGRIAAIILLTGGAWAVVGRPRGNRIVWQAALAAASLGLFFYIDRVLLG